MSSGAQREPGRASDGQAAKRHKGLLGQSSGLAGASVHQAVQAVQVWLLRTSGVLSHLNYRKH